jgi:hypothetical protein
LFAINDSLHFNPISPLNLLGLIVILNIYEAVVIGLTTLLLRTGRSRDAATLLVMEAVFIVDAGFLNAEVYSLDLLLGAFVNIALFCVGILKLWVIFRAMRLPFFDPRCLLTVLQMLYLSGMPGMLKLMADTRTGAAAMLPLYALWWLVAAIPLVYLVWRRSEPPMRYARVAAAFPMLAIASILAHLCTSNWVYHIRWSSANLSPLMLTLAVAIGASDYHVRNLALRMRVHLLLPALAIALSMPDRSAMNVEWLSISFSPLRLAMFGAAMSWLIGAILHRHIYFLLAATMVATASAFGSSVELIFGNLFSLQRSVSQGFWRLVPRTVAQWGVVSVVASFLLLGLGALQSMLRRPDPTDDT